MTKRIKALLQGVGSVLDIAPAPRGEGFVASGSDAERLRADFERIGADMRRVFTEQRAHGQKPNRHHQGPA